MPKNPFPPREERPVSSSTVRTHYRWTARPLLSSPHSSAPRVHRCWWDEEATRAPRGMEMESVQEAPLRTPSNNSFQLERRLEICQNQFQHPSLPLICFSRGMETAAARRWHTHAEMPTEQEASHET